jgi:hypothetical protein
VSRAASHVLRSYSPTADVALLTGGRAAIVELRHALSKWLFDPYRPELHYMRGPGPRWREKHALADPKEWISARR